MMKFASILFYSLFLISSSNAMDVERWDTKPILEDINSGTPPPTIVNVSPTGAPTNQTVTSAPFKPLFTDFPSTAPSDFPSDLPSLAPSDYICAVDSGVFGATDGTASFVSFNYEVEIQVGSTTPLEDIIKALEVAIADAVLPTLFPSQCSTEIAVRRSLRRRLAVTGLSVLPDDKPMDLTCQVELIEPNDPCIVVDSVFTIFTDGADDTPEVMAVISKAAADGKLNSAHEDIVQVVITDYSVDGSQGSSSTPAPRTPSQSGGSFAVPLYVGLSAGALVVIGAAIFYRRRKQSNNVDMDSTIMTPPQPMQVTGGTGGGSGEPAYDLRDVPMD